MRTTNLRARLPHRSEDRGASLVEFALIAVWLFTLIFGIIEGGFAVRAINTVNNATDDAARRGAIAANGPTADWQVLNQLTGRGVGGVAIDIEYVVIYRAENGSSEPTAGCLAGAAESGECNVYYPENFDADVSQFDCSNPALDANWCPTTMRNSGSQLGFLGVYVEGDYEPIIGTALVDFEFDLNANSLQAIEATGQD